MEFIALLAVLTLLREISGDQDCRPMPRIDSKQCLCSPGVSPDGTGEWKMHCFDEDTSDPTYSIEYVVNNHISVKCASVTSPYTTAMFSDFSQTELNTFEFKYCLMPNTPFSDILKGNKVYSLKFESWKNLTDLKQEQFENLSDLKVLSLTRNGFFSLPHNLFNNLTLLQDLSLNENSLQIIDESAFNGLFNLYSLEMGSNLIEELPENVFSQLYDLKELHLYNNKLVDLPERIFHSLQSLLVLDLSRNMLKELPSSVFSGLRSLTKVNLKSNKIKMIPSALFSSTYELTELDLSDNSELRSFPENLFSGLTMLKSIDVESCNISSIPFNLFSPLYNLQRLNLGYNAITELHHDIFKANINLNVLLLYSNLLETLPVDLLEHQYLLIELGLTRNNLQELPSDVFRNLVKLKTLRMSHNELTSLDWNFFNSLQNLEELNLSNNKLREISNFRLCTSLKYADLSRNFLTSIPEGIIQLYTQEVNLEYNNIKFLYVPTVLSDGATIRLGWNNINHVDVSEIRMLYKENQLLSEPDQLSFFGTLTRSPRFYLFPNPVTCDCQISHFISYVTDKGGPHYDQVSLAAFPSAENLTCNQPPSLRGKKVISLSALDLFCPTIEGCPHPCSCYRKTQEEKLVVNCSHKSLDSIPAMAPRNTDILDLSGNKLNSVDVLNNRIWENLTELYLDDNSLSDFGAWSFKQNLTHISLERNYFVRLPERFMNYVSRSSNVKVSLSENLWTCSCSIAEMKGWLIENFRKVSDVSNIYCVDNTGSNVSVTRATIERLCPPDKWQHKRQLVTIVCFVATIPFLVFLSIILYYRRRRDPKAIFFDQPCSFRNERWLWRKFRTIIEHRRKSRQDDRSQIGLNTKGANPDLLKFVEEKISSLTYVPNSRLQDHPARIENRKTGKVTEPDVAIIDCALSPKYIPGPRMT